METFHLISSLGCCTVSRAVWTARGAGFQGCRGKGSGGVASGCSWANPHPVPALHGGWSLLVGTRAAVGISCQRWDGSSETSVCCLKLFKGVAWEETQSPEPSPTVQAVPLQPLSSPSACPSPFPPASLYLQPFTPIFLVPTLSFSVTSSSQCPLPMYL